MFDVGFWEILLILILALIVIGPERLPGAARTAGLWVGKARRYIEGVKNDVENEFDVSEFKRIVHNQEIQLNELQHKLNETANLDDSDDLVPGAPASSEHHPDGSPNYDLVEEKPAAEIEDDKDRS